MKTFTIKFCYSIQDDATIAAKNEKEAIKTFRELRPNERILDVYESDEEAMFI